MPRSRMTVQRDPSKGDPNESDGVALVPADRLNEFLNQKRDRAIAAEAAGVKTTDAFDPSEPRG